MPFKRLDNSQDIDLSLYSHINNLRFLKGTYELEGQHFSRTVSYLTNYVETITQSGHNNTKIDQLIKSIQELITREASISKFKTSQEIKEYCHELSVNLTTQIGTEIYLPGGWLTESFNNPGHSMLYKFVPTEAGLHFYIYNAGQGLQYHPKVSTTKKECYLPIMLWFIPSPIDQNYLIDFLYQLIWAKIPQLQTTPVDDETLYTNIFPQANFINNQANLINYTENFNNILTAGQLSGTCSQSVLHVLIKECFNDLKAYQHFMYHFKTYAFNDYMRTALQNNYLTNPGVVKLIKRTLRSLGRILIIDGLFSVEEITAQRIELNQRWKIIKNTHPTIPAINTKNIINFTQYLSLVFYCNTTNTNIYTMQLALNHFRFKKINDKKTIRQLENGNLLAQIKDLNTQLQAIYNNGHDLIEEIEAILCAFPLPRTSLEFDKPIDFYKEITSDNEALFYDYLNVLYAIYKKSCATKPGCFNNRNVVVRLVIMSIVDYVNHHVCKQFNKYESINEFITVSIYTQLHKKEQNPYVATNSPRLDERLLWITKLYTERYIYIVDPEHHKINNALCLHILSTMIPGLSLLTYSYLIYILLHEQNENQINNKIYYKYHSNIINSESSLKRLLLKTYKDEYKEQKEKKYLLDQKDLTAVDLFIKYQDNLDQEKFKALISKFNTYYSLENILIIYGAQYGRLAMHCNPDHNKAYVTSTMCNIGTLKMLHVKYDNLSCDYIKDVFQTTQSRINSNVISLLEVDKTKIYLYHLRNAPSLQIKLTIQYFKQHLDLLNDKNLQIYVEANLFQPGLLLNEINKDPAQLLLMINDFVISGLKYHNINDQLSKNSLFFIHILFLISKYVIDYLPALTEEILAPLQHRLIGLLNDNFGGENNIHYALNKYQLLTAILRLKVQDSTNPTLRNELIQLTLQSIFYYNMQHNNPTDMDKSTIFNEALIIKSFQSYMQDIDLEPFEDQIRLIITKLNLGTLISLQYVKETQLYNIHVLTKERQTISYQLSPLDGFIFDAEGYRYTRLFNHYLQIFPESLHLNSATYCLVKNNTEINSNKDLIKLPELETYITALGQTTGAVNLKKYFTINGVRELYNLNDKILDNLPPFLKKMRTPGPIQPCQEI